MFGQFCFLGSFVSTFSLFYCALNVTTEQKMQLEVDNLSTASESFGRTISTMMTEVMFQPTSDNPCQAPCITVKDSPPCSLELYESWQHPQSLTKHYCETQVLRRANSTSIIVIMRKAQVRWVGHITRMPVKASALSEVDISASKISCRSL